ncbi:MAG TPA: carboxypeptidase-like regulatory domain-containing protein [Bryobacteraceae bacterium]|nr:carboxypeptidase-like regulatory domain-containing protein [Bryobacteraceae bacterium]
MLVYDSSRQPRSILFSSLAILAFALAMSVSGARAQTSASAQALPDAPGFSSPAGPQPDGPAAPATIEGTVVDTNGDVVEGAHLVLSGPSGQREMQTGADGAFTFANLARGSYKLTITGGSVSTYESPAIVVESGQSRFLSKIVLAMNAGVTEVHVTANQEQLAEEEVHVEESQRVLGIVPNFYSNYDWNAPPLNARQKYSLAFRSEIDPITFAGAAALAAAEEYQGVYPGYGTGFSGFGKRFAAQYANDFTSRMIGSAVLPSLFRQDPRYFYKGTGTVRSRAIYAIKSAFICRGDNGKNQFDYSHIGGDFAAGWIANLYYPEKNEEATLVLTNGLIEIGGMAGTNLIREFLLKGFTTHPQTPHR